MLLQNMSSTVKCTFLCIFVLASFVPKQLYEQFAYTVCNEICGIKEKSNIQRTRCLYLLDLLLLYN